MYKYVEYVAQRLDIDRALYTETNSTIHSKLLLFLSVPLHYDCVLAALKANL